MWSVLRATWSRPKGATEQVRKAAAANGGSFELIELDLANLTSVRACADRLLVKGERFDVIIANAGVMATPFGHTADGFETQFGTNHLGHFVVINRIAPLLRTSGRLINLASAGHRFSNVDLADPNFERATYEPFVAYGRSKTANILFAVEFDKRHRGRGVRAAAVHPGGIHTELARHLDPSRVQEIGRGEATSHSRRSRAFSVEDHSPRSCNFGVGGCGCSRRCDWRPKFCENCHLGHIVPDDATLSVNSEGVRAYALDPQNAQALWKRSEELVGESFSNRSASDARA